jgi:hypothetical protein
MTAANATVNNTNTHISTITSACFHERIPG